MTKNKQTEEQSKINSMCLNCGKFGGECSSITQKSYGKSWANKHQKSPYIKQNTAGIKQY